MPKKTLDNLSKKEVIRYLKQCCKDGLHAWGQSTSDKYEICTRSWCNAIREKDDTTKTK